MILTELQLLVVELGLRFLTLFRTRISRGACPELNEGLEMTVLLVFVQS